MSNNFVENWCYENANSDSSIKWSANVVDKKQKNPSLWVNFKINSQNWLTSAKNQHVRQHFFSW